MEVLVKFLAFIGIIAVIAIVLALPTMLLWNWLMPEIFGLVQIGFWQALGLNFLAGILFKPTNNSSSK